MNASAKLKATFSTSFSSIAVVIIRIAAFPNVVVSTFKAQEEKYRIQT